MEISQIYELVNQTTQEVLGTETVVQEDLRNLVDVGTAIFDNDSFDKYCRTLVDHIGKMVFVNRKYSGVAPSVLMDGWEYGAVLQKVTSEMPEAVENESYELVNGTSYDPNIFNGASSESKFFNKYTTFEIDRSITTKQLKSAFTTAAQMNAFISMIMNEIEKAFTVATSNLIMRTINNFAAETLYASYNGSDFGSTSTVKAVNLLYLYNQLNTPITAEAALYTPEFIRFAAYQIGLTVSRLRRISSLFNVGGKQRFTNDSYRHMVSLADFQSAADVYLQSDVFHNEYTKLLSSESVPYWQGTGTGYSFSDVSAINVKTASNHEVSVTGVLSVVFDREALGVTNLERWTNTNYNGKADFTNYFHKMKAGYFNDFNENGIVFFIKDAPTAKRSGK